MTDPNYVRATLISERHAGCGAELFDNGTKMRIPVCMGGTALVGCNNYENCKSLYGDRIDGRYEVHVVSQDDEGRVNGITTVQRAPLVVPTD